MNLIDAKAEACSLSRYYHCAYCVVKLSEGFYVSEGYDDIESYKGVVAMYYFGRNVGKIMGQWPCEHFIDLIQILWQEKPQPKK